MSISLVAAPSLPAVHGPAFTPVPGFLSLTRGAAAVGALFLLSSAASAAAPVNMGFESGLSGWTVGTLTGAGSATVVASNTTNYSPGDWGTDHTFLPNSGAYFLAISSGEADDWQTVTQTVALAGGQTIGGTARFDWGDYYVDADAFPDGVKVEILDSLSAVVATPFYRDGTYYCPSFCDPETGLAGAESPWTAWSFTAGIADTYTIVYAAKNTGDGGGPNQTFGYFDAPVVPEPETYALMLVGLAALGLVVRQRRR